MSGFVALVEIDGRPVRDETLSPLVAAMAFRGPDARSTWRDGCAALGHAAFRTTGDPGEGAQPMGVDGRLWISGDLRLDDRSGLIGRLGAVADSPLAAFTPKGLDALPDAALLLYAYDAWGEDCVEHLIGDFAFAIWDAPRRTLFAARDAIGVKPFYYAMRGTTLLAGNTLASLRAHPGVSDRLEERAIGDYLLFGLNRHAELTCFADIHRLPAAHCLRWSPEAGLRTRRYRSLRITETIRYRRDEEYVERFLHLLHQAVGDRLRGASAAVLMSGGLDSPSVAAIAAEILENRYATSDLQAFTFVHEPAAPGPAGADVDAIADPRNPRTAATDPERTYSRQVADRLGVPIHHLVLDDDAGALWGGDAAWSAEPTDIPASRRMVAAMQRVGGGLRVGLTGQGGDPVLHVTPADFAHWARRHGRLRAAAALARYRWSHGRVPRVGLRTLLKRRLRGNRFEMAPLFPPWLPAAFAERAGLRRRFEELLHRSPDLAVVRPEAHQQLAGSDWSLALEWYDAGMTGFAAELRHPYLDLRLVEYLLALPPVPWLVEKGILRRAMRDRLPASVLARRKATIAGYPVHATLVAGAPSVLGLAMNEPRLAEFVDVEQFARIASHPERLRPWEYELITRPFGLASWLQGIDREAPRGLEESGGRAQHGGAEEALREA